MVLWLSWLSSHTYTLTYTPTHLFTQEGYRTDSRGEIPAGWVNDGYKGVDARAHIANPNIDYQTLHFYGESFSIAMWNWTGFFTYYAANRANMARGYVHRGTGLHCVHCLCMHCGTGGVGYRGCGVQGVWVGVCGGFCISYMMVWECAIVRLHDAHLYTPTHASPPTHKYTHTPTQVHQRTNISTLGTTSLLF